MKKCHWYHQGRTEGRNGGQRKRNQELQLEKVSHISDIECTVQSETYMINHCDTRITHLGDMDISFVLLNISSKFLLYIECYMLSPKIPKKVSQ